MPQRWVPDSNIIRVECLAHGTGARGMASSWRLSNRRVRTLASSGTDTGRLSWGGFEQQVMRIVDPAEAEPPCHLGCTRGAAGGMI